MPLIPRITYCDYHFVTLGNDHVLTYRCLLDANWHERTALFTWIMLALLTFINLLNLIFWLIWAMKMICRSKREKWVMKKWLNDDDFPQDADNDLKSFAASFKMGNLLLLYYIEAHTDRVVASAFAKALYEQWMDKLRAPDEIKIRMKRPRPLRPSAPLLTPNNELTVSQKKLLCLLLLFGLLKFCRLLSGVQVVLTITNGIQHPAVQHLLILQGGIRNLLMMTLGVQKSLIITPGICNLLMMTLGV